MESIIVNNILKSDFKREAEVQGFEVFDPETVLKIRKAENILIKKSLTQELSEAEINQIDLCKSEVESLKSAYVIDDDTLKKEIVFFRERDLEKAASHKYFKREGTPGNYKYYYTEAEYKQAKGGEESKEGDSNLDNKTNEEKAQYHREQMDIANKKGEGHKYHYHMGKRDMYKELSKKDSKTDITSTDKKEGGDKELAKKILDASGYTLDEIKKGYKENNSPSWKKGYWAAHGLNESMGNLIIKYLF